MGRKGPNRERNGRGGTERGQGGNELGKIMRLEWRFFLEKPKVANTEQVQ